MFQLLKIVECQKLRKVAKSCQPLPKVAQKLPKDAKSCKMLQKLPKIAKSC